MLTTRMGINILYNLLWLFAATTFESRGTKVRQHHVHVPKNNIATLYSWSKKHKNKPQIKNECIIRLLVECRYYKDNQTVMVIKPYEELRKYFIEKKRILLSQQFLKIYNFKIIVVYTWNVYNLLNGRV